MRMMHPKTSLHYKTLKIDSKWLKIENKNQKMMDKWKNNYNNPKSFFSNYICTYIKNKLRKKSIFYVKIY